MEGEWMKANGANGRGTEGAHTALGRGAQGTHVTGGEGEMTGVHERMNASKNTQSEEYKARRHEGTNAREGGWRTEGGTHEGSNASDMGAGHQV